MDLMDWTELIFAAFRLASAGVITGAAGYIIWHQLFTERLRPSYVWSYVGIVLTVVAAFRWFIVAIRTEQLEWLYPALQQWLQPLTQTGYVLLGICFIVMTYTHVRGRERHDRLMHGGLDD